MEFEKTDPVGEQIELFVCDTVDWPVKDDLASMDFPLFSLSKQRDTRVREYRLGNKTIRVIPSVAGAATVFDKDLLLYAASQIVGNLELNKPVSKTIRVNTVEFLVKTGRGDGRADYERILDMLRRLRGTTIETNIPTNNVVPTDGFSMIDTYQVLSEKARKVIKKNPKTGVDETHEVSRVFSFKFTLSDWFYNSLVSKSILTIHPKYYQLSSPTERRMYEVLRKHCGDKPMFKINIDTLGEKLGTGKERFKLRELVRDVIAHDNLPEYHLALDTHRTPDMVVVYTREVGKLHADLIRNNNLPWFQTLERFDNTDTWRSEKACKRSSVNDS